MSRSFENGSSLDKNDTVVFDWVPSSCPPASRPLFLDDERAPPDDGKPWVVVRNVPSAISWMETYGIPSYVSFDHDLMTFETGATLAQWMIDRALDDPSAWPEDFDYFVHSQNSEGARNIVGKLEGYLAHRMNEKGLPAPARKRRSTVGA